MPDIVLDGRWTNLDKAFAELENNLVQAARGLAVEAWNRTLLTTPQYYGRMVASYSFTVDEPVFEDRSWVYESRDLHTLPVRSKGWMEAVNIASEANRGRDAAFVTLGQTVFISNGASHAQAVEDETILLRPINRPGRALSRALDYIAAKYPEGTTDKQADRLKSLRVGFT